MLPYQRHAWVPRPYRRSAYVETDACPLYPFGYGLNYTTFSYKSLTLTPERIAMDGTADVSVGVENTSTLTGDEIIQMYICDEVAAVIRLTCNSKDSRAEDWSLGTERRLPSRWHGRNSRSMGQT